MKTLNDNLSVFANANKWPVKVAMAMLLLLTWFTLPKLLALWQPTVGLLDAGIWQLLLLSVIAFLGLALLCWWLLYRYWHSIGLPSLNQIVSQFKILTPWQQISLYWASFALLFLGSLLSLVAVF